METLISLWQARLYLFNNKHFTTEEAYDLVLDSKIYPVDEQNCFVETDNQRFLLRSEKGVIVFCEEVPINFEIEEPIYNSNGEVIK